jgi:hypothetical protein
VAVGRQIYIDREISAVGSTTMRAEASSPGLLTCLMCVFLITAWQSVDLCLLLR